MEQVNKYHNGKIYAIKSPQTEKMYIGSTADKYICTRFHCHNYKYKKYLNNKFNFITSFEIIKLGDAYIETLELYPCNNKQELLKREGQLIIQHKSNCVNKKIEGINTKKRRQEYSKVYAKKYYQNNYEFKRNQSKKYYVDHKEHLKEYQKQYQIKDKKSKQMHDFIENANDALNKMKIVNKNNLEVFKLFQ